MYGYYLLQKNRITPYIVIFWKVEDTQVILTTPDTYIWSKATFSIQLQNFITRELFTVDIVPGTTH